MMSLPIVWATAVPERTPIRLSAEAMQTAWKGDRDRVETTVAMALEASVHPFTNSAPKTRSNTIASPRLRSGIVANERKSDFQGSQEVKVCKKNSVAQ